MTDWLDTRRERVELRLTGGRVIAGDVHLQLVAENHSGPESPVDFFNRAEPFFAVTMAEAQPVFVAKAQLLAAIFPPQPAFADPARESAARRIELEVELADGSVYEGIVMLELPPDRLRLLDFLNLAPAFFALWSPEAVRLLNRSHVRAVSPLAQVSRGQA